MTHPTSHTTAPPLRMPDPLQHRLLPGHRARRSCMSLHCPQSPAGPPACVRVRTLTCTCLGGGTVHVCMNTSACCDQMRRELYAVPLPPPPIYKEEGVHLPSSPSALS